MEDWKPAKKWDELPVRCGRCGVIIPSRKESYPDYFTGRVCKKCYEELVVKGE